MLERENISLIDVKNFLGSRYTDIGKIEKIKMLNTVGLNSRTFLIKTNKDEFLLKKFLDKTKPLEMERVCNILRFCIKHNQNVLEPILNVDKKFVDKKNRLYLTKYYHGKKFSSSPNEIINLAKNLSQLHKVLQKVPNSYYFIRDSSDYNLINHTEVKKIKGIIRNKKNKDKHDNLINARIDFLEDCILNTKDTPKHKTLLKKQFIHNDLNPDNILFQKDGTSVIIDFGSLKIGNIMSDVVFCSFRFSIYNTTSLKKIKKRILLFLENYKKNNNYGHLEFDEYIKILLKIILGKISFLLRQKYFQKSDLWTKEILKFFEQMEICLKIFKM